jgi:uncharacterized protein YgiM (DUF1202 family)
MLGVIERARHHRALALALVTSAMICAPAVGLAEKCRSKSGRPMVWVKDKVSIRRGPGLNYPVSSFLTDGKCVVLSEVSTDKQWALIEDEGSKTFGWVNAKDLDSSSRDNLPQPKSRGPIGSGQERGYISTKASASLLSRPEAQSEIRKVLPPGARLLAISMTEDGRWVEVRDDRGERGWVGARGIRDDADTLSTVPRATSGFRSGLDDPRRNGDADRDAPVRSSRRGDQRSARRSDPREDQRADLIPEPTNDDRDDRRGRSSRRPALPDTEERMPLQESSQKKDLTVSAVVLGLFALPRHGFDSNGQAGIRRYAVRATSGGGHLEGIAQPLGAFRARLAYDFVLLTGLAPSTAAGQTQTLSVGGQEHAGQIMLGYPILLGSTVVVPEIGYSFALFAMQPMLPVVNAPVQFLSNHSHALTLGGTGSIPFNDRVGMDVVLAAMVGTTVAYPENIGAAGLTLGFHAGAGIHIGIGGGASLLLRWDYVFWNAPFSGPATGFDPTITSATITHLENIFSGGVHITF